MKKLFKGMRLKDKVDKSAETPQTPWVGVEVATKGMSLTDILNSDKKYEENDNLSRNQNWFHTDTNRNLAELRLREAGLHSGMFLVRASLFKGNYVLSMVANATLHHYHIKQRGIGCYYIEDEHLFKGVDDLVNFYRNNGLGLPTSLKIPCKGSAPPVECRSVGYNNILHQSIIENVTAKIPQILDHPSCPNIHAKNTRGYTALHEACVQGLEKVVKDLLEKRANPNVQQEDGYTPLMLCCIHNKPAVIQVLVEIGKADTQESQYPNGNVALHEAASKGHMDCVKALLDLRAPAWPRNCEGDSPHQVACTAGHKKIAKYIADFQVFSAGTSKSEWYYGDLSKQDAEAIMQKHDCKEGVFLVRKSSRGDNLNILVLCNDLRIYNFEIATQDDVAFYIDQGPLFPSLEHVIEYYSIRADGLPTRLQSAINPKTNMEVALKCSDPNQDRPRAGSNAGSSANVQSPPVPRACTGGPTPRPPEPIKLNIKDITIAREIGEGEYGAVYRGTWLSHEKKLVPVAIKTLHVRHASSRDDFLKEARVMVQLNHQCIVQLIGVCFHEPKTYLVQELVKLGSMLDYMLDYPERINVNPNLYLWASQVASGMSYLEEKQFVHRDLAARNILLKSRAQAKVGDFGLSRAIRQGDDDYQASVGGRWPIKWYAPECVNYGTFTSNSDVWSYGVTLWEMFTLGEQPYGDKTGAEVITLVERGRRLKRPKNCNAVVYAQMNACWAYDSKNRPTFRDLENFFSDTYSYIPGIKGHKGKKGVAKTSSAT